MTITAFPVPPVVKTVTVRAPPKRAFAVFADDFARWWPLAQGGGRNSGRLQAIGEIAPRRCSVSTPREGLAEAG